MRCDHYLCETAIIIELTTRGTWLLSNPNCSVLEITKYLRWFVDFLHKDQIYLDKQNTFRYYFLIESFESSIFQILNCNFSSFTHFFPKNENRNHYSSESRIHITRCIFAFKLKWEKPLMQKLQYDFHFFLFYVAFICFLEPIDVIS